MKTLELLAPAGSPEALDAAIGEGADAVYLGLKDFNARLRSANFTYAQFEGAMRSLRRMGKKVYVTVNTVFEQREADRMYQFLKYLNEQQPDAIIVQDFGVIAMARSEFPNLRLHASTQMNIASARGANALSRFDVSRVVLARELSLNELQSIKKETNLELEVFVHGALCISVSGICLFSSFLGGKSANRGMCTQACRRLYHRLDGKSGYYFSPNDLQLLEHVPDLAAAGIKALKIEGRMKSASYVGAVVSAYRLAADAVMSGDEDEIRRSIEKGQEILRNDFARPKTQYLFGGIHTEGLGEEEKGDVNRIDWLNPEQDGGTGISLGTIQKMKGSSEEKRALITPPRGIKLTQRDSIRIHRSDDSQRFTHKLSFSEKQAAGNSYWISVSDGASINDNVYLIQTKEMRKRYAPVITTTPNTRGPGREKAPAVHINAIYKKEDLFPEGLYTAVSRPEDLYILQSSRPVRVMLTLSQKTARQLLSGGRQLLPFKPSEIILTLEPWFGQDIASYENDDVIKLLTEKGYHQYVINNPGHLSLFRGLDKVKLIAGQWLYAFNSWSFSFIESLGVHAIISPLENNRQNLERTIMSLPVNARSRKMLRSRFFINVFAWPPLFDIRANLGSILDVKTFSDNTEENFFLETGQEGSRVYPEKYFSIVDKIPFLKEAGFGRFVIDLNGPALKKSNYRDLMRTINENAGHGSIQTLPHSSRFNWKDGFYKN
jgi:putative protease